MGEMGGDPMLNPDSFRAPTDAMKFAADNPDAFKTFLKDLNTSQGSVGIDKDLLMQSQSQVERCTIQLILVSLLHHNF